MIETSGGRASSGFSCWLRTGKFPPVLGPDGLELKFNPWHDPADGRFTYAGAGRLYGAGETDMTDGASGRVSGRAAGARGGSNASTAALPQMDAKRAGPLATDRRDSVERSSVEVQTRRVPGRRPVNPRNPVAEFVGGVGEELYAVGEGAVAGVHAALTTNPATTVRNATLGMAGMIDAAIAAEDTPARIQVSRAARVIANASARDIGRATGAVAGNVALAVAPGAALSKAAALRRLRIARPRATYEMPTIGWVKETTRSDKPWKSYNDTAPGARAGYAPTLMRTTADGSKRPVKFDGVQGDYVVDRKWSIVNRSRARAQLLRQSEVLAEHRLIGLFEVPVPVQKTKALKIFKKMNITNIHVKVVKP